MPHATAPNICSHSIVTDNRRHYRIQAGEKAQILPLALIAWVTEELQNVTSTPALAAQLGIISAFPFIIKSSIPPMKVTG
ncbi:hypothetical protein ACFS6H_13290 [Terrimonas rubra]|uniref:Uncharacterized protein n=1 Tax=Terrimonas rubra TaxID=1035890 RepID=A0ABW6A5X8_9BACT